MEKSNDGRDLKIEIMTDGGASSWQRCKTWRSPSSPQINQKYTYMWNNSYRTPPEHWQKTSDFPKGKKIPNYLLCDWQGLGILAGCQA